MGLVWGASFLFMKVALDGVSYGQIAWSREILGAITLGLVMLVGRHRLPRERVVYLHFVVIAITNCVIPHTLFAWAEQHVSSGLAAIYNSVTPIATAILVAVAFRVERLNRGQMFGVVLGVLGVIVIIAPWQYDDLSGDLWGQLACIAAAVSYGIAIGYMRKFVSKRPISGTTVAFLNIGMAAIVMLLLTPFLAIGPVDLTFPVVASLVLLGAFGTGFAFIWNIAVLRAWGPTTSSTVTYLIPVVAVVLGFLVLGETLSWHEPVGAVLVLVGILYTQQRLRLGRGARTVQGTVPS
jgi:drug/metabolite transporter (DMT)-like permease